MTGLNDDAIDETRTDERHADGDDEDPTFDGNEETVTDAWVGAYISDSFGYNQTNVYFAQITEVSDSGKTVLARRVAAERVDTSQGSEHLRPDAEQFGDEFRLHVRTSRDEPVFRGSYPFVNGDMDDGSRMGTFLPFDNEPGKTVRQTAPNHGH